MFTDAPPGKTNRLAFLKSDQLRSISLPDQGSLLTTAKSIEQAMHAQNVSDVRRTCLEFLTVCSGFYEVPNCGVRVLAARPLRVREGWSTELFGDYAPETMLIRVWMRTAVRKEFTSFGTFLSTLCHEFCHHLDFHKFQFQNSWHTRGFYERTAALYHHARGTPSKRLFWLPVAGGRCRIDWPRTNRRNE
jgi:hypothetical protein